MWYGYDVCAVYTLCWTRLQFETERFAFHAICNLYFISVHAFIFDSSIDIYCISLVVICTHCVHYHWIDTSWLSSIALGCQHWITDISCHKRLSKQLVISGWQVTVNVLLSLQFSFGTTTRRHRRWRWPVDHVNFECVRCPFHCISLLMTVVDVKM